MGRVCGSLERDLHLEEGGAWSSAPRQAKEGSALTKQDLRILTAKETIPYRKAPKHSTCAKSLNRCITTPHFPLRTSQKQARDHRRHDLIQPVGPGAQEDEAGWRGGGLLPATREPRKPAVLHGHMSHAQPDLATTANVQRPLAAWPPARFGDPPVTLPPV